MCNLNMEWAYYKAVSGLLKRCVDIIGASTKYRRDEQLKIDVERSLYTQIDRNVGFFS